VARFPRIVTLSRYVARELAAVGVDESRIRVVPPPVSRWAWDAPSAAFSREGAAGIVVPGRVSWHKGCVHLLEAVAAMRLDVSVTFAGGGPGEGQLREAAARLGLASRVIITGWLDDAALVDVMRRADVVVLPWLWAEPFGIAGLEACALGLPVVVHDVGGVSEWLEHERTGLLVPPADGRALAEAVRRVLHDPALAGRLGAAAREDVRARFSREAFSERWVELLAEASD
jgi:glycosyltransferase involved in cell wall biosynthesis